MPIPFSDRLSLPAIAAPMTAVSGTELVIAACRAGVIGAFPTHNATSPAELGDWLDRISSAVGPADAPFAPNLIMHRSNTRLEADLETLIDHGVELVITSVGSPAAAIGPLHAAGARVFADVASLQHVDRAIEAGADGLVLLTAGAGGQTGWANPFAFVRAARARFDGTIVVAGGMIDGASILAAQVLGADLVYFGTRFIATEESLAPEPYRAAVIEASLDEVRLSTAVGGLPASLLAAWLERDLAVGGSGPAGEGFRQDRLLRRQSAWSAGHSVSGVRGVTPVAELVSSLTREYQAARDDMLDALLPHPQGSER